MSYFSFSLSLKFRQALSLLLFLLVVGQANAQEQEQEQENGLEVYGFIKIDIGYNFDQLDPNWFETMRVTKLPKYENQFGPNGNIFFSVRETQVGINTRVQTPLGQLKSKFEFDLFGSGPDEGQTTFHFRKAYAELGRLLIGQTESTFTDTDVSPKILDYGAPSSRPWLRNIQLRYTNDSEQQRWAIALEQPDVTSDEGVYADRIELQNVKPEFKVPDLTAEYRKMIQNGYVELAGVLKWIRWENTGNASIDLSGEEVGWGFNISSIKQLNRQTLFKGQFVVGKGIQNHLTDAAANIGIENNFDNPSTPILGVALPVVGGFAFLEHKWTPTWSSTLGYSRVRIYNSDAQAAHAFKNSHYAILNLLYQPFSALLAGTELQWGKRNNFSDGFDSSAVKIHFSLKYSFSHTVSKNGNK
ncbi:DcaP family trimeric outer membrane transporter [Pontibacter kalidii]|uniref:DcaP family trimeric outer membrane transporter n=1 Tax=Pontibacter kalidii TaxID=2592049 RepID=UPI00225BE722|nr:DcaP family trimeric outer membrane transporter [Pontibacter kalidii]